MKPVPHPMRPAPAAVRQTPSRPIARRPSAWRLLIVEQQEVQGELARDRPLALVEAALMLADEPLTSRRLAAAAGLPDAAEANRLVQRLRELYRADDSAFQVEEL